MSNNRRRTRGENKEKDEVEELLQAAEDEILLKISLNSHLARSSSSSLDRDLIRRFEALKSPSVPSGITSVPLQQKQKDNDDDELHTVLGADLSARFSALKAPSSSSTTANFAEFKACPSRSDDDDRRGGSGDDEDEVSKIIQWAIDAARLDPSRSDNEDDDDDNKEKKEDEDDDDDTEEEEMEQRKARK